MEGCPTRGEELLEVVLNGPRQMVSAPYRNGIQQIEAVRREMAEWLEPHEYDSQAQARAQASMNLLECSESGSPRHYSG